jgi:PIN domain nuclease of toxin-antitoxin system
VSIWEAIILLEKKKIEIDQDFGEWVEDSRKDLDLQEASLDWKVAQETHFTLLGYNDPADRFLVATARVYDLVLVTADQRILSVPRLRVFAKV